MLQRNDDDNEEPQRACIPFSLKCHCALTALAVLAVLTVLTVRLDINGEPPVSSSRSLFSYLFHLKLELLIVLD